MARIEHRSAPGDTIGNVAALQPSSLIIELTLGRNDGNAQMRALPSDAPSDKCNDARKRILTDDH